MLCITAHARGIALKARVPPECVFFGAYSVKQLPLKLVLLAAAAVIAPAVAQELRPRSDGARSSVDAVVHCGDYGSVQACHDALPASGGKMILAPDATYIQTATIRISKPNVTVECPSWNTVLRRGPGLTYEIMTLLGEGDIIRNCTIDGNGATYPDGYADLGIDGVGSMGWHIHAIHGGGSIQVRLGGANSRSGLFNCHRVGNQPFDGTRLRSVGDQSCSGHDRSQHD